MTLAIALLRPALLQPIVVLRTSVRERGAGKSWILDRETLLSKSVNLIDGDLDDPCKYLLLFVTAYWPQS